MQNIKFPVNFQFKVTTLANDFIATDADQNCIAYVRQKMFKFKEDIQVFNNESKEKVNYSIKADRWLDFSAAYTFLDENGQPFGKIVRKGWRSLWKAKYEIIGKNDQVKYTVTEENAFIKIMDSLLGEIPFLNLLSGYFFNPAYLLTNVHNHVLIRLKKKPSLLGRNFELTQVETGKSDPEDDDQIMLGLMMMILLERRRG